MTWSPFLTDVTPGPVSTTTPAPSCPRIAGNSPSGSLPDRVNSSVWQMPVALISTSTPPAFGPSSCTWVTGSSLPASHPPPPRRRSPPAPRGGRPTPPRPPRTPPPHAHPWFDPLTARLLHHQL